MTRRIEELESGYVPRVEDENKPVEAKAYCGQMNFKSIDNIAFLNEMYNMGILDGIECVHTKHNKEQIEYLVEFAKEKRLIITGGSDLHLDGKQKIGHGVNGSMPITEEYLLM